MIILAAGLIPAAEVIQSEYQTPLTKNGAVFDYRAKAGQKLYGYNTLPYGETPGNELQCIFHDGDRYNACFYYSTSQKHDNRKHHVSIDVFLY